MHIADGCIAFSPSDLADFASCSHATTLALRDLDARLPRKAASEELAILQDHGIQHEKAYLDRLKEQGRGVFEIPQKLTQPERVRLTTEAMRRGEDVIFQAALESIPFRGYADFLLKVSTPSNLGPYSYEVADTKLASSGKARHLVQIALYSDMVEATQGKQPVHAYLELGSSESKSYRLDDYRHYVARLKGRFLAFTAERPSTTPEKCAHCKVCPWQDLCADEWKAQDHLNQVARITSPQIRRLKAAGITTLEDLASATGDMQGMGSFPALKEQASLQLHKRRTDEDRVELKALDALSGSGFFRLPEADAGDLYFDMEGYPYEKNGLEYLFGVSYVDGGELRFKPFWGHDRAGERKAFEQFVGFVVDRVRQFPNLHIYHYADYERRALEKLMQHHGVCELEVDSLFRDQRLVDFYAVVREAIMTSEPRYSIKNLETFYMKGERESEVKNAGASIVYYDNWRRDRQQRWLDDIERYNEEDCISTKKLHDWLLDLRERASREFGLPIPWYTAVAADEDKEAQPKIKSDKALEAESRKQVVRDALHHYLDGLHEGCIESPQAHAAQTLVYLLDFYWREAKPGFWKMFYQQKRSAAELIDDMDALGGLVMDAHAAPVLDKQSMIYRYRMPAQDHRLKVGDNVRDTRTLNGLGTIHAINPESGTIDLRIGIRKVKSTWDGQMPSECSVAAANVVSASTLDEAIVRVVASRYGTDACDDYGALWALLERSFPQVKGVSAGDPILSGESSLENVIDVASRLQKSYLIIQGPPGTGKTYAGARVIVALLAQGKRVGVSAMSHHAIANLLDAVTKAAIEAGLRVRGARKGDGDVKLADNRLIEDVEDAEEALDPRYKLVGGTAWLFARASADQAFDYLFIDEAGQTSLANLVAMGSAARNIVLLGDQMQLGQPLQGTHPGDCGLSALEYLLRDNATVPPAMGVLLNQTWRMHPNICRFISSAIYEGRLVNHPDTERQRLILAEDADSSIVESGIVFNAILHEGCAQSSPQEASRIAELVSCLLQQSFVDSEGATNPLTKDGILIVAPYNAQVRLLKEMLPEGVLVGTVDKFQGKEAEVVIVSMTTSGGEDMPRDMAFLFDRRRLNVAISRAKTLAIIVGSPRLLDINCRTPEQMALADTLCWAAECSDGAAN